MDEDDKSVDWREYDHPFYWNFNMYRVYNVPTRWRMICIQGYFDIWEQQLIDNQDIKFGILSRRQYKRGGTRLNARGIDDEGFVGNYVETESFFILNNILYTFVQIRGSIPLFWQQKGLKGDVVFKRDPLTSVKAVKHHFHNINEEFGKFLMVNLLKEKSEREQLLTSNISQIIEKCSEIGDVEYFHYDFHKHKIENLHLILKGTDKFILRIGYYKENLSTKEVLRYQKGVIRTNWMDCLDRTNFAQTKMYIYSLQSQLEDAGVDLRTIFSEPDFEQMGLAFADIDTNKPIVSPILNMWANNGDYISLQYTGTNSTISMVMKEGK